MEEDKKFLELWETIKKAKIMPKIFRLLLMRKKQIIRVYNEYGILMGSLDDFGLLVPDKAERGPILESFSKMEFTVNELMRLNMLGPSSDKIDEFDSMLENINFWDKAKILQKWDVIDKPLRKKISLVKQVRDSIAHKWSLREVEYDGKIIQRNFQQFKKDMQEVWEGLLNAYMKEQTKIDIDEIIKQLKELNPSIKS